MKEIRHRSRTHTVRGQNVMPTNGDVAYDPECQAMLARLGSAVGDINASYINRVDCVTQVAATIRDLKAARA